MGVKVWLRNGVKFHFFRLNWNCCSALIGVIIAPGASRQQFFLTLSSDLMMIQHNKTISKHVKHLAAGICLIRRGAIVVYLDTDEERDGDAPLYTSKQPKRERFLNKTSLAQLWMAFYRRLSGVSRAFSFAPVYTSGLVLVHRGWVGLGRYGLHPTPCFSTY